MPHEIIVFDTNACRNIGQKNVDAVHHAHRAHSVVSVASKFVAMELVSAATCEVSLDAGGAWSGLRALVQLSKLWDGRDYVPFARSRLDQRVMSGEGLQQDAHAVAVLGWLLLAMAKCDKPATDAGLIEACREVREYVLKSEEAYGAAMCGAAQESVGLAKQAFGAESDREAQLAAAQYLRKRGAGFTAEIFAMRRDGIDETSDDAILLNETTWMQGNSATAIEFVHQQIIRTVDGSVNPTRPRHANSVWDAEICALIDRNAKLRTEPRFNGAPVVVVASDSQILTAAERAGHRSRIRSLGEHCATIGLARLASDRSWL